LLAVQGASTDIERLLNFRYRLKNQHFDGSGKMDIWEVLSNKGIVLGDLEKLTFLGDLDNL